MKELIERTISNELIDGLTAESIKVIGFAEVGAQGDSEHIALLSDDGSRICRDEGEFSFTHGDRRLGGGVDIENVYKVVPFLGRFLGNSSETTQRGNFLLENGEWIHLDAQFGNHLFIRYGLGGAFMMQLKKRPHVSLARHGIELAVDMLRGQ